MESKLFLTCFLCTIGTITAQYSYEDSHEESEKISFEISGRDLPSQMMDTIDPYVKVFETSGSHGKPVLVGSTEVIQNSPNPDFEKLITFNWKQDTKQKLNLVLMDENPLRDTNMGEVTVDADSIGENPVGGLNLLKLKKGTLTLRKVSPLKLKLEAVFNKAEGVRGDPFLEYYWRLGEKGNEKLIQTGIKFTKRFRTFTTEGQIEFPRYYPNSGIDLVFKVRTELDKNELSKAVVPLEQLVEQSTLKSKETKNGNGAFSVTLHID